MVTIARANLLAIQRSISALGVDLFSPNYFAFFTVGVQMSLDVRHCLSQCGNVYNLALKRVGHTTNVIHATTHRYLTSRMTYTVSLVIVLWIITLRLCHWLFQCTLKCHWIATGWPSVHWDITGWLVHTCKVHWKNLVETAPHLNANGDPLTIAAYTGTPTEGLNCNSLHLTQEMVENNQYQKVTGET